VHEWLGAPGAYTRKHKSGAGAGGALHNRQIEEPLVVARRMAVDLLQAPCTRLDLHCGDLENERCSTADGNHTFMDKL